MVKDDQTGSGKGWREGTLSPRQTAFFGLTLLPGPRLLWGCKAEKMETEKSQEKNCCSVVVYPCPQEAAAGCRRAHSILSSILTATKVSTHSGLGVSRTKPRGLQSNAQTSS